MIAKDSFRLTSLVLVSTALLGLACGGSHDVEPETTHSTISASVATVERLDAAQEVEVFGTVEAEQTAAISVRVMAMVTAVRVKAGDVVTQGPAPPRDRSSGLRGAGLAGQGRSRTGRRGPGAGRRNYERFQALAESNAASELELDMARMQYEQAKAPSNRPRAPSPRPRRSPVTPASSPPSPAEWSQDGRGRRSGRTRSSAADHRVHGRAATRRVDPREPDGSGQARPTVTSCGSASIRSPISTELTGSVVEIPPGADPASHSFQVKLALHAPELPSGATGRAFIPTDEQTLIAVPDAAVLRRGGIQMVVVRTERRLRQHPGRHRRTESPRTTGSRSSPA